MLSNYLNKISKNIFDATNTHISIENPASNLFLKQVTVDITPQMRRIHEIFRETNRTKSKYTPYSSLYNESNLLKRKLAQAFGDENCDENGDENCENGGGNSKNEQVADTFEYLIDALYCNAKLSMVQKNFVYFVLSMYKSSFTIQSLATLETIIVNNFDRFYTIFLYLIYNSNASNRIEFNNQQKRIRTIPITQFYQHLFRHVYLESQHPKTLINFVL